MLNYPTDYPIFDETETSDDSPLDKMRRAISDYDRDALTYLPEYYCQRPWLYFLVDGGYLKCLGVSQKIQCEPEYPVPEDIQIAVSKYYPKLFAKDETGSELPYPLYRQIYNALAYQKFTPYYETLMKFKWKAGLMHFSLFDFGYRISVKDGLLYGMFSDENGDYWKPLTDEIVTAEIEKCYGHRFRDKELKTTLAKELLKLHEEHPILANNNGDIRIESQSLSISYNSLLDQADISYKSVGYSPAPRKPNLSPQGYSYLHELTQGKIAVLDDIAELLARLYQPKQPSTYLWVILGRECDITLFLRFLSDLGAYASGSAIYDKPSPKRAKQLIIDRHNGKNCQINPGFLCLKSPSDIDISSFRKFIAGETVDTTDDPYIVNNDVKGEGVLLCAATELCEDSLRGIPHKVIAIPHEWSSLSIEESDYLWMQTCLLCHGFHLLSRPAAESAPNALNLDDAIGEFVTEFCTPKEGVSTDRGHFYNQFKKYCDVVINMPDKLPGSTIFSKQIEKRFCWSSEEVRSNKNRLGYKDLFLDDDRIAAAIREAEEQAATQAVQTTPDDFKAYLDSFVNYLHIPGTYRSL